MYIIEKKIPMPKSDRGRPYKYPFEQMEVGDSFFVPKDEAEKARNSALQYARREGKIFHTRKENDGARIWRTK